MAKTHYRAISAAQLERRIVSRSNADPEDQSLDQAIDLADLHARDRSRFRMLIQRGFAKHRRAYYLRKVGARLLDGSIRRGEAELVGWTKLEIIADKITPRNAQRLLQLARTTPANQLKQTIRGGSGERAPHCVLMYFDAEQYAEFSAALLSAGARRTGRGIGGKEDALMSILTGRNKVQRRRT